MSNFYIKANRVFSPWRKYSWIFTLTVAIGGLWFPLLGLLVIPVMIGLTAVSFFKGRYWCGNICPHGSLFDSLLYPISKNKKIPSLLKSKAFGLIFLFAFFYKLLSKFVSITSLWGNFAFWERLGFIFVSSYLMVTIVGGAASIALSSRTWCNFCPMGTIQKGSYALGKLFGIAPKTDERIVISDVNKCYDCGKCAKVCPMQLAPHKNFDNDNSFKSADCIKCSTCVAQCPAKLLDLKKTAA